MNAGRPMMCDRDVVKQCVTIWFGSTEAFEELIRSDVSEIARELRQNVFTRGWVLQVCALVLWGLMDLAASTWKEHQGMAYEFIVIGLVVWLLGAPMVADLVFFLTRRYCSADTTRVDQHVRTWV